MKWTAAELASFTQPGESYRVRVSAYDINSQPGTGESSNSFTMPALPATITSVSPPSVPTGREVTFTVSGTNLTSSMTFALAGCSGVAAVGGGSPTSQQFRCTPSGTGNKAGTVAPVAGKAFPFNVNVSDAFASITSVEPLSARLDILTTFTVQGVNLPSGMQFDLKACTAPTELAGGTSSLRKFTCVPRQPGAQPLRMVVGGVSQYPATVKVERPARLGNVQSRGVPMVGGVSLFNGNLFLEVVDLAVPGKGLPFVFSRSYNSYNWIEEKEAGGVSRDAPWRFSTDLHLGFEADTANRRIYVQKPDGSAENFYLSGTQWRAVDLANFSTIKVNTDGSWSHIARSGLITTFEAPTATVPGRLRNVADRDGNQLTYTYDLTANPIRLSRVTDASGRQYTFTYNTVGQLWRVADFTGRYVEYTYTVPTGGRIRTVRDVRDNTTTYTYTTQGFLETVTDARLNRALKVDYTTVYGNTGVRAITTAVERADPGRTCGPVTDFTYCYSFSQKPDGSGFVTTVDGPVNQKIAQVNFDNAGRALAIADAEGNTSQTQYNDEANGDKYALAGLVTQSQSPRGVQEGFATTMGLDLTDGLTTGVTDPENGLQVMAWNKNAASNLFTVASRSTPLNHKTTYGYTTSGRLSRITAPEQDALSSKPSTVLGWSAGMLTSIANPKGETSTLVRDASGNLKSVSDPRNSSWLTTNDYDPLGRVIKTTDPRGGSVLTSYDEAGNVTEVRRRATGLPDLVTTYQYDANGNQTSVTDPRLNTTTMAYDAGNRLTRITRTVSGVTTTRSFGYDGASRLTSITNENGNASNRVYDGADRVKEDQLPLGRTLRYLYDADSRIQTRIDPEGRTTRYTYDKVGRTTSVTLPTSFTTQYEYDPDGRLSKKTDAKGLITQYGYDRNGNLTSVKDPAGVTSTASYNDANQMVSRTDPRGQTTQFGYDAAGNMTSLTDPLGNQWSYTYDPSGNLTSATVPVASGQPSRTTSHQYDAYNRLTKTTYPGNSQVNYSWDNNGNLATMVDSVGTTSYQYDEANRLKSLTDPFGVTLSYTYDKAGNRQTVVYPGNRTVTYGYDAAERMASVTDWTNRTASYTYNLADQVTQLTHGNGSKASYAYDQYGQLSNLSNTQPGGQVISSHQMSYDRNGNISNATEVLPLEPTLAPRVRRWAVDAANRVLSETVAGSSYVHDPAGRLTSQIVGGATTTFGYNERDLLTSLNGPGRAETYRYNGHGHRVERSVNGAVTRYLVEPNGDMPNVLAELNGSNSPQRFYVHGVTGLLAQIDAAGNYRAYHAAPIGNVLALTDGAGTVTDRYAYTPYGETTASGNTLNPFRYVGKYGVMDEGSGLSFMRARYYKVDVNRFLSEDPLIGEISDPQEINRYAYAAGSPGMQFDPSGKYVVTPVYAGSSSISKKEEAPLGSDARVLLNMFGEELPAAVKEALIYSSGKRISSGYYEGKYFSTNGCGSQGKGPISWTINNALDLLTTSEIACDVHDMMYALKGKDVADNLLSRQMEFIKQYRIGMLYAENKNLSDFGVSLKAIPYAYGAGTSYGKFLDWNGKDICSLSQQAYRNAQGTATSKDCPSQYELGVKLYETYRRYKQLSGTGF